MGKMQKEINLDETQKRKLLENLDENGRLSCLKAFKVARLIGLKPIDMSDACKGIDVKITNCELGVFGKLKFQEPEPTIYNKIKKNFNDTNVPCKELWQIAQGSSLRRVGSVAKNSEDIEVINCQLGCFRFKKGKHEIKN